MLLHCASKNNPLCWWAGADYYLVKHSQILIIFGRHIPEGRWLKWYAVNPHFNLLLLCTTLGNKNCKFVAFSILSVSFPTAHFMSVASGVLETDNVVLSGCRILKLPSHELFFHGASICARRHRPFIVLGVLYSAASSPLVCMHCRRRDETIHNP